MRIFTKLTFIGSVAIALLITGPQSRAMLMPRVAVFHRALSAAVHFFSSDRAASLDVHLFQAWPACVLEYEQIHSDFVSDANVSLALVWVENEAQFRFENENRAD